MRVPPYLYRLRGVSKAKEGKHNERATEQAEVSAEGRAQFDANRRVG